jgi:hypothetical protein
MTNYGEHDASPFLNFPVSTFFWEHDLSAAFRVKLGSVMRVPETQSIFICAHNETLSIAAMRVGAARHAHSSDPANLLPSTFNYLSRRSLARRWINSQLL